MGGMLFLNHGYYSRPVNGAKVLIASQALNLMRQRGYVIKNDSAPHNGCILMRVRGMQSERSRIDHTFEYSLPKWVWN